MISRVFDSLLDDDLFYDLSDLVVDESAGCVPPVGTSIESSTPLRFSETVYWLRRRDTVLIVLTSTTIEYVREINRPPVPISDPDVNLGDDS